MQILAFDVERRQLALPLSDVQEIARAVAVTGLPDAPAFVAGVIDVRGTLVPVLDLRWRFGLPRRPVEPADHLVLARTGGRVVALHVDGVDGVVTLDANDVEDPRSLAPGAELFAGAAKLPRGLVLIHDLRAFLSEAESEALGGALAAFQAHGEGAP
jgi:purine-binding chemotaxis protein CheW